MSVAEYTRTIKLLCRGTWNAPGWQAKNKMERVKSRVTHKLTPPDAVL